MNNAFLRVSTGIGFLVVVFATIFSGKAGVAVLFSVIVGVCFAEYLRLLFRPPAYRTRLRGVWVVGMLPFASAVGHLFAPTLVSATAVAAVGAAAIGLLLWAELTVAVAQQSFYNIAFSVLGVLYVVMPFTLLLLLYAQTGVQLLSGLLILNIVNDSLAYFWGKILGKTPFFPHISPKKTWEGAWGGAVLTLATAVVLSLYYPVLLLHQWLTVAGLVVVFGTSGDLVESLLKRSLAAKDSGNLLPGHGGLLDRFDGLLLVLPFVALYLAFAGLW